MKDLTVCIRKHSLNRLLTSCREAITPEEVGLRRNRYGRCKGLSQAAAAHLAGVSAHWWCDLENGRLHAPHAVLLDAVAVALRMTEHQRADLYFLATGHPPATSAGAPGHTEDGDLDLVHRAQPSPALVTDYLGNVLARNAATATWFPGLADRPGAEPNLVLWLFGRAAEAQVANLPEIRALRVGELKSAVLRHPDNDDAVTLVERLVNLPDAAQLWQTQYATLNHAAALMRVRLPDCGERELAWIATELPSGNRFQVGYPAVLS